MHRLLQKQTVIKTSCWCWEADYDKIRLMQKVNPPNRKCPWRAMVFISWRRKNQQWQWCSMWYVRVIHFEFNSGSRTCFMMESNLQKDENTDALICSMGTYLMGVSISCGMLIDSQWILLQQSHCTPSIYAISLGHSGPFCNPSILGVTGRTPFIQCFWMLCVCVSTNKRVSVLYNSSTWHFCTEGSNKLSHWFTRKMVQL